MNEDTLKQFALAIKEFEDFVLPGGRYRNGQLAPHGSLSYRNNNPGNLRHSIFEQSNTGEYSYFNTLEQGQKALEHDIKQKCLGKTKTGLNGNSTIYEFCKIWAPVADNNDPYKYAVFLATQCNLNIYSKLKLIYPATPKPVDPVLPKEEATSSVTTIADEIIFLPDTTVWQDITVALKAIIDNLIKVIKERFGKKVDS